MELTLAYLELLFVIGRKTIGQEYSDKGRENTEGAQGCDNRRDTK